jgi:hypothetical protein
VHYYYTFTSACFLGYIQLLARFYLHCLYFAFYGLFGLYPYVYMVYAIVRYTGFKRALNASTCFVACLAFALHSLARFYIVVTFCNYI